MRLDQLPGDVHLTYCTNIHAGETWSEVRASLGEYVPQIKSRVSPRRPMGLGLRLSAIAAEELENARTLDEFRRFLADRDLYVFTINAFPYGPFHGRRVKEDVYQPDWLQSERVAYTNRVATILAALLPAGMVGSVSTVPGTFKPLACGADAAERMAENIACHVAVLIALARRTGREIALALEPEPCCFLETVEETIVFFRDYLHADFSAEVLAKYAQIDLTAAREALQHHVAVCYDICHGAVEFEDPATAFAAFRAAGIRIAKLQLSSALRISGVNAATEQSLATFEDGVYLHQVVQKRGGALTRYVDLAPAFTALRTGEAGGEWRVHCHVPIFLENAGAFRSTQLTLKSALAHARAGFIAPHLEVETYTWDVLPPQLREGHRADAIARELEWVLGELS